MQNQAVLYGIIGFLAGSLLTVLLASSAVNTSNTGMMRMMGMQANRMMGQSEEKNEMMHGMDEEMSMEDMVGFLKGKSGDGFDKAFIEGMIIHHQGAIDMASSAKQNAKHDEIKKLADEIISAQTREIEQMREWQKDWGYTDDSR